MQHLKNLTNITIGISAIHYILLTHPTNEIISR